MKYVDLESNKTKDIDVHCYIFFSDFSLHLHPFETHKADMFGHLTDASNTSNPIQPMAVQSLPSFRLTASFHNMDHSGVAMCVYFHQDQL